MLGRLATAPDESNMVCIGGQMYDWVRAEGEHISPTVNPLCLSHHYVLFEETRQYRDLSL